MKKLSAAVSCENGYRQRRATLLGIDVELSKTRPFWVYVVECMRSNHWYVGFSAYVIHRCHQHLEGEGAKFVRDHGGPKTMTLVQGFRTREAALSFELAYTLDLRDTAKVVTGSIFAEAGEYFTAHTSNGNNGV